MDVVTYLTSALLVAGSLALVVLGFRFDVARRRQGQVGSQPAPVPLTVGGGVSVTPGAPSPDAGPSLDGFTLHYDPVEEDLHVYSRLALFAPVTRPVVVHNGGHCLLFGPCAASLVVRPGGTAVVYALVAGDVVNEGGELHVHGQVLGTLRRHAGSTTMHPLARVAFESGPAQQAASTA